MKIGTDLSTQTSTGQTILTIRNYETYQTDWRKVSTQTGTQEGTLVGTPLVH